MSETKASRRSQEEEGSPDEVLRTAAQAAPALVLLAAVGAGVFLGVGYAVLILTAGALVGAIAGLWNSIRALFGETELSTEDAFALGAPTAEEEQKRAVLRAIKDLEFEHGVGKISEHDYQVMMARYRQEARRLLQRIDDTQQPDRERAEKLVHDFLAEQGIQAAHKSGQAETAEDEAPSQATGDEADVDGDDFDESDEDLDEDDFDEDDDDYLTEADEEDEDLDEEDEEDDEDEEDEEDDEDDEDEPEEDVDDEDDDDEDDDDEDDEDDEDEPEEGARA